MNVKFCLGDIVDEGFHSSIWQQGAIVAQIKELLVDK